MNYDLTLNVFKSIGWFAICMGVYYVLTLFKVHILAYIQPRVINNLLPAQKPFLGYWSLFRQDVSASTVVHKSALRYLARYKKSDWLNLGNKKINLTLGVIERGTEYLKPYLILGAAWIFLKLWFETHYAYDELRITLASVQNILAALSKLEFFKQLQEYKNYITFLIIGVGVFVPFLNDDEIATKKVSKYFAASLTYLSIILGLSFFGASFGHIVKDKEAALGELRFEVIAIHDSIYSETGKTILLSELTPQIAEADQKATTHFNNIDTLFANVKDSLNVSVPVKYKFENETRARIANEKNSFSIPEIGDVKRLIPPDAPNKATSFVDNHYKSHSPPEAKKDFEAYMGDAKKWNKKEGEELLERTKLYRNATISQDVIANKKINSIVEALFELIISQAGDMGLDYVGMKDNKLFGAVYEAFATPLATDKLAAQVIKVVDKLRNLVAPDKASLVDVSHSEEKISIISIDEKLPNDIILVMTEKEKAINVQKGLDEEERKKEEERIRVATLERKNEDLKRQISERIEKLKPLKASKEAYSKYDFYNGLSYDEANTKLDEHSKTILKQMFRDEYSDDIDINNGRLLKQLDLVKSKSSMSDVMKELNKSKNDFYQLINGSSKGVCWCCGLPLYMPCLCGL